MKVLVADKLPAAGLDGFRAAGFDVISEPALKDEALVERVGSSEAQILVVRSTKVPRAALEAGKLGLVIRAGAGYNNVDVAAASALGVYVANCPGKNAIAVAELTWGLILSLDRQIPACVDDLRAGKWNKKGFAKANGLFGRTLGVIGLGEIGKQVVLRAKAFGMPVVAWSRSLTPELADELGIEQLSSTVEVAKRADVASVHVALNDQTRGMIGGEFFDALRPGSLFVNTSRGAVVDGDALEKAVKENGIRAGLDVWPVQPSSSVAKFEDPLGKLEGVIGTHHIGASTAQAQEAVAMEALRVATVFKQTGDVHNCVNLSAESPTPYALVVRHHDRVGVLAFVLENLREAQINVQQMHNVLFEGEDSAACATIHVNKLPTADLLAKLGDHEHVIEARVAT